LQIGQRPDEALITTVTSALQPRNLLLVRDNCEHLIGACADLADRFLRGCPQLRLLTTSREILALQAETVWSVPPLTVPGAYTRADVADSEAVQLFIERAQASRSGFVLTDDNARLIVDICRALDGIPLAIELASARMRVLSLSQIQQRLSDHIDLLSSSSRMTPDRHQTLRATIDWSYGLLSSAERRLFNQLAAFAGGWTLEAAEAVSGVAECPREEVLDLMTGLVDKSLVLVETEGRDEHESRYRLLETIRGYAAERLLESGELESTRDRHLARATRWAEGAAPHLTGPDQVHWMALFVQEHDNLRAALDWSRVRRDEGTELRLVAAMARYWVVHGPTSEGHEWFAHALSLGSAPPLVARATVLDWTGRLASLAGEPGARGLLQQSVSMARQLDDRSLLSVGLRHLAFATLQQGDNVAARALHEEALTMARQAGNRREEAFALSMLGLWEAEEGDTATASLLVDEALEAGQEAGDQGPQSTAYCARGIIAAREGQFGSAKASFEKGLELSRSSDHYLGVAMSLMQLGAMALARGDELEAREYARDCVTAAQNAGVRRLFAAALQFFAQVELQAHRYTQAVRVAAAETNWRKASPERQFLGLPWIATTLELGEAQRYLGAAGYSREWSIGQRMTLEQAGALTREPAALEDLAADEPEPLSQGGIEGRPKVRLTDRQLAVLKLVAQGQSNREIAHALQLSEKTVGRHLENLFNRLSVSSRSAAAA
jgi:predicted ATPase/DNA-binding CsgD family transcriptional regulator